MSQELAQQIHNIEYIFEGENNDGDTDVPIEADTGFPLSDDDSEDEVRVYISYFYMN